MSVFADQLGQIQDLLDSGGYVLWAIGLVSVLLWTLILERYVYLWVTHPSNLNRTQQAWSRRRDQNSWQASKIRQAQFSQIMSNLGRSLAFIGALISICPLLGLLGTVVGMIHVFDLMAVTGTGDARAMASGVSLATIPTMAGMVVALSGLFFRADLQQRVGRERQRAITLFHGQRG